jgi:hypothetical protein
METVDDLISAVRSQLDETNTDALNDTTDILPALRRGQDYAVSVLARNYPDPLMAHTSVSLTAGTAEYAIPEDAYEDRISRIEIETSTGVYQEVRRVSYQDITQYETSANSSIPLVYCIVGRKYRFAAAPSAGVTARVWYVRNPDKLMKPQGRITVISAGSNYLVVDVAGSDLDTVSTNLESYINVIDGQTGEVRTSYQIQSISDTRITMRSSPIRSSVLGRTISGTVDTDDVSRDDYICSVEGTCVVQPLGATITNFIIQYAVNELTRRAGGDTQSESQMLDSLEKQVQRTDNGRESTLRVQNRSRAWQRPLLYTGPRTRS